MTDRQTDRQTDQPTNQPTNQPTTCMKQIPFLKADSRSADQEFPSIL
jgi:hypothetical protein